MKYKYFYLFFVIFVLKWFPAIANPHQQFSWIITINTNGCVSCLNELSHLSNLDSTIPKMIVFKNEDKRDSAVLIQNLFLKNFRGRIVFSDSLYNKFENKGHLQLSSVCLYNQYNGRFIKIALSQLAYKNIDLNRFLKKKDTIQLNEEAYGEKRFFNLNVNQYYALDVRQNKLNVFSRITNRKVYDIMLNDSMLQAGYKLIYPSQKALTEYQKTQAYIQRKKAIGANNQIRTFQVKKDTVMLLVSQPLIQKVKHPLPGQADTEISSFYTLYTFKGKNLIGLMNVENYLNGIYADTPGLRRHTTNDKYDAYFIQHGFFEYKHKLFLELISGFILANSQNWALAAYKEAKENKMVFSQYAAALPAFYIKNHIGYNFLCPETFNYFGPYFTFALGDTLYSVDSSFAPIPLSFIPKGTSDRKVYVNDFKISNGYLYILVNDGVNSENPVTLYYKYNLSSKKVVAQYHLTYAQLPFEYNFPRIDPFDFSCIISPADADKLIRYKLF